MDKMVSACYCEPLRIPNTEQDYKLEHLLHDNTAHPFPSHISSEMVEQCKNIKYEKWLECILLNYATVSAINNKWQ